MFFTHVCRLLCFFNHNVIMRIGCIWWLRNWGIRLRNGWSICRIIVILLEFFFTGNLFWILISVRIILSMIMVMVIHSTKIFTIIIFFSAFKNMIYSLKLNNTCRVKLCLLSTSNTYINIWVCWLISTIMYSSTINTWIMDTR